MIANLEIHFGHSWKLILKAPLDAARNESATGGDASSLHVHDRDCLKQGSRKQDGGNAYSVRY